MTSSAILQASILYGKQGKIKLYDEKHKTNMSDISSLRNIEDGLVRSGIDLAEKPHSYSYGVINDSRFIVFFDKSENPIVKFKDIDISKSVNVLSFVSNIQKKAIMENVKNSIESNYDVTLIGYLIKVLNIDLSTITWNDFAAIILISRMKSFKDCEKKFKSIKKILHDGIVNDGDHNPFLTSYWDDPSKIKLFRSSEYLNDLKKLQKKWKKMNGK